MSCIMTYILHNNYNYTRAVYYYYDHFLPLSVRGGTAAAPPGPPPGRWRRRRMSCMMTYILHNNNYYNYTRAVYYYYDRFLPLSVRGTRQHFLLLRPKTQVCPVPRLFTTKKIQAAVIVYCLHNLLNHSLNSPRSRASFFRIVVGRGHALYNRTLWAHARAITSRY